MNDVFNEDGPSENFDMDSILVEFDNIHGQDFFDELE